MERKDVIWKKIEENPFNFYEYMESYNPPHADFLRIIVSLHDKLDDVTFTNLFVRVCASHKGDNLKVSPLMIEHGMRHLVDEKMDHIAAYGLLRLVFLNRISLFNFELELLLKF
jgi:hypothetical protein